MVASWSLGPLVEALRGLRGLDLVSAATLVASTGDLSRFESPRFLMGYLGLVPSEHSSGGTIRRGGITKTVRETEAEAVAFVVGKSVGLLIGSASADYIQLYHGDASLLAESLEVVQQTANVILTALEPQIHGKSNTEELTDVAA